jgi:endonuclease/exonuclease/phosphatase family metal-dependent hydrolase
VTPLVLVAYVPALARIAALSVLELLGAPGDLRAGLRAGEDPRSETKFLLSRVVVGVMLRELSVLGMAIDLARGRRVIHGNFLGYDENAHRRGPDSDLAFHALGPIDAAVARLWRVAHRSHGRAYDVWVIADHGQEATESYVGRHGETVADAVGRVATELGIVAPDATAFTPVPAGGIERQRSRQLGERAIGRIVPGLDLSEVRHEPGTLAVAAQGPVGLVYLPAPMPVAGLDGFARAIVARAAVPMVLRRGDAPDTVVAHLASGRYVLPRDAAAVLGEDHPYRREVAADLVALVHHPDAGDLVLSGWRTDGRPVSFPFENGAHAGPGPQETDAFALVPPDTPISPAGRVVRPADLRRAGLARLAGSRAPVARRVRGLRVLTYNVHGCVGMDGRLSPERIARVIARQAPDVVALQELDVGRARSGGIDQARAIADALEMEFEFHPTVTVAGERFGDAVLSRHPMRLVHVGALPGVGLEPRGAIRVDVTIPDGDDGIRTVPIVNTHLSLHPVERIRAARALLGPEWLGAIERDAILCGDFNALAWFPTLALLRRRLADVQTGLDGHRPRPTWFGRYPVGRIDHVLVDPEWTVMHVDVPDDSLARVASDHRPLVADLAATRGHDAPFAGSDQGPLDSGGHGLGAGCLPKLMLMR